tara:strand:+ start:1935 stop:2369 length:435 start_codon:yes stop_codon:yes gene_type:complete
MNKYAWDIYSPHFVGLDDIFHRLDSMSNHNTNYPPYNLIKHDNSKFTIEIALAGFKPEEIEVSTESNILKVATKNAARDPEVEYLHRGVSKRSFVNTWQLSDDVKVGDVRFEDGLLVVQLNKYIPEHQRRIVYDISGTKELLLE